MRVWPALLGLLLATASGACAFLLDFDELQSGSDHDASVGGQGGSGGSAGSAGSAGTDAGPGELPQAMATAICARLKSCRGPLYPFTFGEEDCEPYVELLLKSGPLADFAALLGSSTAHFTYHPDQMAACLAAMQTAPCDTVIRWPAECSAALEGTAGLGGACVHSLECPAGQYCNCTKCVDVPKAGEPCADGICAQGTYCDRNSTCQTPVAVNGVCEGGTAPHCVADSFCLDGTTETVGKCSKIATLFDSTNSCDWALGHLCQQDYYCAIANLPSDASTSKAGSCTGPAPANDDCQLALPDSCPSGFYCNVVSSTLGKCKELPGAESACAIPQLKAICKKGSRCIGRDDKAPLTTPGTCKGLIKNGELCSISELCYSGLCVAGACKSAYSCLGS